MARLILFNKPHGVLSQFTDAAGRPTLRLIRGRIGDWTLDGLAPGQWRELTVAAPVRQRRTDPVGYRLPRRV